MGLEIWIIYSDVLCFTQYFISYSIPVFIFAAFVVEELHQGNLATVAHSAVRNLAFIQQADQVRAAHVEDVGRLLSGQLSLYRLYNHCMTSPQLGQQLSDHIHRQPWQNHRFLPPVPVASGRDNLDGLTRSPSVCQKICGLLSHIPGEAVRNVKPQGGFLTSVSPFTSIRCRHRLTPFPWD